jgi:hypothetical protein
MASLPFTLPGVNETKLALAGAMAGGFTNLLLHPIDTAKTLRQSNPAQYPASLIAVLLQHGRYKHKNTSPPPMPLYIPPSSMPLSVIWVV